MENVTAGRDGRLAPAPKGDIYRRDPEAARAQAIRERIALYRRRGLPVPEHLQHLYESLPPHEQVDVELVDEKTGKKISDVQVVGSGRSAAPPEELAPPPGPFSRSKKPPPADLAPPPGPFSRSKKPPAEPEEKAEPVVRFEPYEVPKPDLEPLEVEAVDVPEKEAESVEEPVKPLGGTGELGAQGQAVARAAAKSPPPRKPGRPRKANPPR